MYKKDSTLNKELLRPDGYLLLSESEPRFESHDSGELSSVTSFSCKPGGGGWRSVLSWTAGTWLEVAELGSSDQRSNEG